MNWTDIVKILDGWAETFQNMSEAQKATTSCAICMADFEDSSSVCELNCQSGHIFHLECLKGWYKFKSSPE